LPDKFGQGYSVNTMPEYCENKPALIDEAKPAPLAGTIEWLGKAGNGLMRGKKRTGIFNWLPLPVIGIGVLFFLFTMLALLIILAIFLLLRMIGSMPSTSKLPRSEVVKRIIKSW
jgi:hypothetical protein